MPFGCSLSYNFAIGKNVALPAILGKNDHGHLDTKSTSKTDRGAHDAGAQGYFCAKDLC